ncbi:hypothetical protein [Streptomyces bottropensis]|uniref:hypothetical protein n=1 Tax=Streptomyces TaxID=1883 RepID=UPI00034B0B13|nr:hypothetical protein [Streptomyces bottropensis]MZD22054.1 hypothetical protein [Streptomyces sp. SID5476]
MATARSNRTPAQLADECRALERVHWPTVWAGPPAPGRPLEDWCAQFGWKPRSAEWVLDVTGSTGQGMALYPAQERGWAPVKLVSWTPWGLSADDTSENDAVLDRAADAWSAYEAALRPILGEPEYSGAWDDPGFPEPWHEHHWLMPRDLRLEDMCPYRMTIWRERHPEDRVTVLKVNLGPALEPGELRRPLINITCRPPEI